MTTVDELRAQIQLLETQSTQFSTSLRQTQEAYLNLQPHYEQMQADIQRHETTINAIAANNTALEARITQLVSTGPSGSSNNYKDLYSRITKTDLLKSKEIPAFHSKDNFELWAESFKNDLFAKLPEAKDFINHVEKT